MGGDQVRAAAEFLRLLRGNGAKVDELPPEIRPGSVEQAYEIQHELIQTLGEDSRGWFVALTSVHMQRIHGAREPIFGRILSGNLFANRQNVRLRGPASIEAEIAFKLGRDMPGPDAAISMRALTDAIDAVVPVIEIVEAHYTDLRTVSLPSLIADNGTDGVIVLGNEQPLGSVDIQSGDNVTLHINGKKAATGNSSNAMGDPLRACLWLAHRLSRSGDRLKAGDLVVTGNCLWQYSFAKPGDSVEIAFEQLGRVTAHLEEWPYAANGQMR